MKLVGSALGLLETNSIAAGVRAADDVLKAAAVHLVEAAPISPGKFLVIFTGGVGEVEASLAAGRARVTGHLVDELLLARVHASVPLALDPASPRAPSGEAIGVVETLSVASAIAGADAAAKSARVTLLEIAPGRGIGGKAFFTLTGDVAAVEAAAEAALAPIQERGYHLRTEILAAPHPVLAERLQHPLLDSFGRPGGSE